MQRYHNPAAAQCLARALVNNHLSARERRIIERYMFYAANGALPDDTRHAQVASTHPRGDPLRSRPKRAA